MTIGPGHTGFYETYESCRVRVLGGREEWTLTAVTLCGLIQELRRDCKNQYHRQSGGHFDVLKAHLKIDLFTLIPDPDILDGLAPRFDHESEV